MVTVKHAHASMEVTIVGPQNNALDIVQTIKSIDQVLDNFAWISFSKIAGSRGIGSRQRSAAATQTYKFETRKKLTNIG